MIEYVEADGRLKVGAPVDLSDGRKASVVRRGALYGAVQLTDNGMKQTEVYTLTVRTTDGETVYLKNVFKAEPRTTEERGRRREVGGMSVQSSPLPWRVEESGEVVDAYGDLVAVDPGCSTWGDDARVIVACVNAAAPIIEAARGEDPRKTEGGHS